MLGLDFDYRNIIGFLGAGILSFIIGMLWYGPLFGSIWLKAMGITQKDIEKAQCQSMTKYFLATVFNEVWKSWVVAVFLAYLGISETYDVIKFVLLIWSGFIATNSLNGLLWEGEKLPLYLVNVGNRLFCSLSAGLFYNFFVNWLKTQSS